MVILKRLSAYEAIDWPSITQHCSAICMNIASLPGLLWLHCLHGRSKQSGWSGFGWTSFHCHFWNCTCADNKFFSTCATHACTIPWLQQMNSKDDIPEKPHHQLTISFQSAYLGKREQCPMPSNLLGLASGSGSDFTSWLSAQ